MIRIFQPFLLTLFCLSAAAQSTISGKVTDETGEALTGANIYLKDTYDGATSDLNGYFQFHTMETGDQLLVVSFVGYELVEQKINADTDLNLSFALKEAFSTMDAVSISAGTFEASDEKKVVVLKSLDIATTAGATADITGALNTLPGTQTVGESGRLFVRGGTSEETKVYIDGAEAVNYYGTSTENIPTRSRFSPFLFKGTFFSTGGYSAEYGQALSSALILNTLDPDTMSKIEMSLMSVGADAAVTKAWDAESVYARIGYLNLNPYNELISQRIRWIDGTTSLDGTFAYKKQFDNGASLKALAMGSRSHFALRQNTILNDQGYNEIAVTNANLFGTANVELPVGQTDYLYLGTSANWNKDDFILNETEIQRPVINQHFKAKYVHEIAKKSVLNTGVEIFHELYEERISELDADLNYRSVSTVAYAELDQYLSKEWMFRGGARLEHHDLLDETTVSPRFSMAHKINESEQVSFASGLFYQRPNPEYLRFTKNLSQEQASHFILNYQRIKDQQIFRVESYYKDYRKLITYADLYNPQSFSNAGDGYAYGLDVFWRDRGGIKNLDYWVSYSWLKSERLFRDFPERSEPGFSSAHNFSLVLKRWFPALKSQMGATYSFTSGRPYENPNRDGFNESRTKAYHDLSYNIAYLPTASIIVYLSATNLLGIDQIFDYNYTANPDPNGNYQSETVRLPAKRFLFLGCFITIGAFNKQLENL